VGTGTLDSSPTWTGVSGEGVLADTAASEGAGLAAAGSALAAGSPLPLGAGLVAGVVGVVAFCA
jgi:hypothetical protein